MISVFSNPWSLVYTVGKNLLVNGVDIFHKIEDATTAYDKKDYFNFGRYCGEAMDEVFFHSNEATLYIELEPFEISEESFEVMVDPFEISEEPEAFLN